MKQKAKAEFIPLEYKCTYHHKDENGVCKNCNDTMIYKEGNYLIYTDKNGVKLGFFVDSIK